ncbi:MAG: hypothetical protein M0Q93_00490 [Terrimicrobiaceae bacterium]|nr:hypothetical protein [Terrimicrobiaceae bacterium]
MNDADIKDVVDKETGQPLPSVMTFEQAYQTYKNFVTDNKDRNGKNAAISRKLNGEQPWSAKKLKSAGQSWRSNRPTGFMSSLMKRLTPPYKQMVDQLSLLTYSRFPHETLGADRERDIFRKRITDCIKQWSGWADFLQQLIDEDIGFGYAAVGRKDEYSWKPKVFRSDEALFYVGCPQQAGDCKIWGLKEDLYVDEVVAILKDPLVAADAGWQVEGLVKKLNGAEAQFNDKASEDNTRVYEDLARENNLAATFTSTVRVIKAAHLFATNPQGGIDHYMFDRNDGGPLFFRRHKFSSMTECLTLFSAEVGDRTLHGSRGAGRILYNTHVSVEQARNLVQDALHLSGLLLLKRTSKSGSGNLETPGLTVSHPFAIVGDGFEVLESVKFEINSDAFITLDRQATSQAEVLIGAFMPGQIVDSKGERRTASEVNYVASVDAQIRAGVLARFADQVFELVDQVQRRICNPDIIKFAADVFEKLTAQRQANPELIPVMDQAVWDILTAAQATDGFAFFEVPRHIEADAVECVLGMLEEKLTVKQILVLAHSSSRANVDDAIASQSGVLDMIVTRYAADPMIDTVELKRRDISAKLGAEAATRLLNVDLNPLSPIKQQRVQLSELSTMLLGNDTPVDPTDDDVLHLNVLTNRVQPMVQDPAISPLTSSQQFLTRVLAHAKAHVQGATQKGIKPDLLAPAMKIIGILEKYVQVPPIDGQAAQVVAPAVTPGVSPMPSAPTTETPVIVAPEQVISTVANPVRPSPPRGQ